MMPMDTCPVCGRAVLKALVRVQKQGQPDVMITMLDRHMQTAHPPGAEEKKGPKWL